MRDRRPPRRRPGPAHDHEPRARSRLPERRALHRHARDARAAALGVRGRPRTRPSTTSAPRPRGAASPTAPRRPGARLRRAGGARRRLAGARPLRKLAAAPERAALAGRQAGLQAALRGEKGDQEAGPRPAEGLLVNQRRRGWVSFHSERDGSRPASRARLTHSVWAWRRAEWSPSGKSSTWSLIEASRRPQSGHV